RILVHAHCQTLNVAACKLFSRRAGEHSPHGDLWLGLSSRGSPQRLDVACRDALQWLNRDPSGWDGSGYRQETRCVLGEVARQEDQEDKQVDSEWHRSFLAPPSREPVVLPLSPWGLRYDTTTHSQTPKEDIHCTATLSVRAQLNGLQSRRRTNVTLA